MKKMTIYYRKRNGEIDAFIPTEGNMDFYGDLKEDYVLTHDFMVLDYDEYVVNNMMNFEVKEIDGEYKLKFKNSSNLNKYI